MVSWSRRLAAEEIDDMDWEDSDLDGVSVDASEWDWEESDWSGDERIDDVERIDDNEEMMSDEEGGGAWPGCREEKQVFLRADGGKLDKFPSICTFLTDCPQGGG